MGGCGAHVVHRLVGSTHHLLLYDGVCGLCNRLNRFVLARDRRDRFRFASLQGALAAELLRRHGHDAADLDTVYVVAAFDGSDGTGVLSKSRAILFVLTTLGGIWSLAGMFRPVPTAWLDAAYDFVARRRYLWFGQSEVCILPRPEHAAKFLD